MPASATDPTAGAGSTAVGEQAEAEPLLIERRGAVGILTLNRPKVSNALEPTLLRTLHRTVMELAGGDCRAVVLTGAGRNFCAGADLAAAQRDAAAMDLRSTFHPALLAIAALPQPVIAAVNGAAAGGGLGLALAADVRFMAADSRLVPAWPDIGLVPDLGASHYAARLLGEARAFEWLASGETIDAARAVSLGLAREAVEPGVLLETAIAFAGRLADKPGDAAALTKRLLRGAATRSLAEQIECEQAIQAIAAEAPGRMEQVMERLGRHARDRGA